MRIRAVTLALGMFGVSGLVSAAACGDGHPAATEGGNSTESFVALSGPCSPEGAVHDCHVSLGSVGSIHSCYVGVQECRGGAWSSCGGRDITLASVDLGSLAPGSTPASGGVRPLVVAVSDGGQCALDPCNPYCSAYNEDAGLTADSGSSTSSYTLPGGDIFGGAPAGFATKSDCGSSSNGCNDVAPGAPYSPPRKCGGEDHYSIWDSCLADTHCDVTRNGGKGACAANWDTSATTSSTWDETKQTWTSGVCPGVDLTVSAACEVGGVAGFNVCNRGNTALSAASVGIEIGNGNGSFGSSTFSSGTCPVSAPSCSPAVPGGTLAPGSCFRVTNATCAAWSGSGNPVAYVNSNRAITECGGNLTSTSATGPGCNNNWADVKHKGVVCNATSAFVDTSRSFPYLATCGTGNTVRWRVLTYQATVPCSPGACGATNTAKVEFYGALSTTRSDGTVVSASEQIISAATTTKTVNCTFGVDAGGQPTCPVDLATWANGVVASGATYANLVLRVRLIPTPDGRETPTLGTWALSYDCVPNE